MAAKHQKMPTMDGVDAAMSKAKASAKVEDTKKRDGVTSITGKALTGDALAKFKGAFDSSALLQKTFNPDGTKKADVGQIKE